jgi:hypothetical protein
MIELRGRMRAGARRVLLGAGLVALLTTSLATPSLGAPKAPAASGRTDVFIRDVVGDTGIEPDPTTASILSSPDIRSCNTAIMCAADQAPIVGGTSYVFVNLNNPGPYGSGVSSGTLYVYYTTIGTAANWPADWTPIGAVAVTSYPGVTTVTVPWVGVPSAGHFCLLARWVSGTDPMVFEGPNTQLNAKTNNNIAWHNIATGGIFWGGHPVVFPLTIGNVTTTRTLNDLVFTEPAGHFETVGTITLDLGPLYAGWVQGGAKGTGISRTGGTSVILTDPANARISGLAVDPGTKPQTTLTFASTQQVTGQYVLDVSQQGPGVTGGPMVDLGGAEYYVTVSSSPQG